MNGGSVGWEKAIVINYDRKKGAEKKTCGESAKVIR